MGVDSRYTQATARTRRQTVEGDTLKECMLHIYPMATARRQRFIRGTLAWMLAAALVLSLLSSLTYELFFVVSLIGLLVVVELTAPFRVTPTWRSRLKWLIALGLAVFGYIVVRRILEILPAGVI
jgi:dolichyl-phosphate-mannose--protein O-mannosyl transferase